MASLKYPDIFQFTDYRAYLTEFTQLNQSASPMFSHRFFARLVKWPVSYLGDVLASRRNLTVRRALQFSRAAKMDVFATERLLFFVLKDDKDGAVRDYFSKSFAAKQNQDLRLPEGDRQGDHKNLESLFVFNIIAWAGKRLDSASISKLSLLFPDLTPQKVERIMTSFLERGVLKFDSDQRLVEIRDMYCDEPLNSGDHADIHTQYAENAIQYWEAPRLPHYFFQGFVSLPKDRFEEIRGRILLLRNWLLELEGEYSRRPRAQLREHLLFQLDLNLFPALDEGAAAQLGL